MKIEYLGHACCLIENDKGNKFLFDPYTGVGYEMPSQVNADVVFVSHGHFDHNYLDGVKNFSYLIAEEGSYNLLDTPIEAIPTWHDEKQGALRGRNLIFKMKIDGLTLCHFGDLGEPYSLELAEKLVNADILFIPVGGRYTIDAKQAKEYIERIKPLAVIPIHYRPVDGKLDIAEIQDFLKEMTEYFIVPCSTGELSLSRELLDVGKTKIFYMERRI